MIFGPKDARERAAGIVEHLRRLTRFERSAAPAIARSLGGIAKAAADAYATGDQLAMEMALAGHAASIDESIRRLYLRAVAETVASAKIGEPVEAPTQGDLFTTSPVVRRVWFNQLEPLVATRVQGITETTRFVIESVVTRGLDRGDTVDAIAAEIRHRTGGEFARGRAQLIARTESQTAASVADREVVRDFAREAGIESITKEWVPVNDDDDRTRDSHASMRGVKVPLDGKFLVDGELMDGPGDPSASARNLCNCRCVLVYHDNIDLAGE